jgi:hypothetical protein
MRTGADKSLAFLFPIFLLLAQKNFLEPVKEIRRTKS